MGVVEKCALGMYVVGVATGGLLYERFIRSRLRGIPNYHTMNPEWGAYYGIMNDDCISVNYVRADDYSGYYMVMMSSYTDAQRHHPRITKVPDLYSVSEEFAHLDYWENADSESDFRDSMARAAKVLKNHGFYT